MTGLGEANHINRRRIMNCMAERKKQQVHGTDYTPDYIKGQIIVIAAKWYKTEIPQFVGEDLGYPLKGETDQYAIYKSIEQGYVYETGIGNEERAIRKFLKKPGVETAFIFDKKDGRRTDALSELTSLVENLGTLELTRHGKVHEKAYQKTLDAICEKVREMKKL